MSEQVDLKELIGVCASCGAGPVEIKGADGRVQCPTENCINWASYTMSHWNDRQRLVRAEARIRELEAENKSVDHMQMGYEAVCDHRDTYKVKICELEQRLSTVEAENVRLKEFEFMYNDLCK